MTDQKKFLDYEGVKHLWSKVNMQDYPNNETLMAVINAIDETKADRSELVQSDWNQNDETSLAYIQNRTHYTNRDIVAIIENLTFESAESSDDYKQIAYGNYPALVNGQKYNIIFDGEQYEAVAWQNQNYTYIGEPWGTDYSVYPFCIEAHVRTDNTNVGINVYTEIIGEHTISISSVSETVIPLDEKYIPWPNENDAIELVTDMGLVSPVVAEDGSIYTDENGALYSL